MDFQIIIILDGCFGDIMDVHRWKLPEPDRPGPGAYCGRLRTDREILTEVQRAGRVKIAESYEDTAGKGYLFPAVLFILKANRRKGKIG